MDTMFDVVWLVGGECREYTFTNEQDAIRFVKELESKGYEPNIVEWSSE